MSLLVGDFDLMETLISAQKSFVLSRSLLVGDFDLMETRGVSSPLLANLLLSLLVGDFDLMETLYVRL